MKCIGSRFKSGRVFSPQKEHGAALFVSLVILLVLSIIGISAMRGGLLQSLMAANVQQQQIAKNVADAGVSATWAVATEQQRIDGGVLSAAAAAGGDAVTFYVDNQGDLGADAVKIDDDGLRDEPALESRIDLVYVGCAKQLCGASSLVQGSASASLECTAFRADGAGTVGDTSASVSGWLAVQVAADAASIADCVIAGGP